MPLKVPYSGPMLEAKLQEILARGKDKLSQLFLVIKNDLDADFEKELPEEMIRNLRLNLKTGEFHKKLKQGRDNLVMNFDSFKSDIESVVDTNKIRVFFSKAAPHSAILTTRVFNYPNVSLPSARPFQIIGDNASHITAMMEERFKQEKAESKPS